MQKSIIFLYTSSEQMEIEIIHSMAYNSTKNIKYLGINLRKYLYELCAENSEALMKEIKKT